MLGPGREGMSETGVWQGVMCGAPQGWLMPHVAGMCVPQGTCLPQGMADRLWLLLLLLLRLLQLLQLGGQVHLGSCQGWGWLTLGGHQKVWAGRTPGWVLACCGLMTPQPQGMQRSELSALRAPQLAAAQQQ